MFVCRLYLLLFFVLVSGCSETQTLPYSLRAGDIASISAGFKHDFSRNKITVTITPSSGAPIVYLPNDPAVRAVINLYPDPLSSLRVSDATSQNLTPYASTYIYLIDIMTSSNKDWWVTNVFLDLPDFLPLGVAYIDITSTSGETTSTSVNIIEGIGKPEGVVSTYNEYQLSSLERLNHFSVSIDAAEIPYGVQLDFTHNLDSSNGGVGKAHVINPTSNLKNIIWVDDGGNLKVIITPSQSKLLSTLSDFNFYVTGGIENLQFGSVVASDMNGNKIAGINVNIIER